jgi:hypothetical protein
MTLVRTTVDAWVDESRDGDNNGQAARLRLRGSGSGNERQAYIFFGRPFPLGATVFSATLRIYLRGTWSGSQTITARRVIEAWAESRITWANKADATTTNQATASVSAGADEDQVEIDLTDMLGDVAAGSACHGVKLLLSVDSARAIYSSEAPDADLRPVLEIDWSIVPEAPIKQTPNSGKAISEDQPLLDWQFAEHANDGPQRQAYSQVQISDDPVDFSSPEYDSGMVANTQSSWDLDGSAFTIADSAVRYWRVRVQNDQGLESEWSDVAEFTRQTKGTLTIVNPPASPPRVSETTPPLSWTFTGRTQKSYEVKLLHVKSNGRTAEKHVWPRTKSDDTSVTVPKDIIKTDRDYRVVITIWDDQGRAAVTGDPDYVRDSRDFTYQRDGSPDPVTSLTAEAITV